MPPGGDDHGRTEHYHPLATGRDVDAPPRPPPLFPATTEEAFEISKKQKQQEQEEEEYLPENALFEILSRVPYKSLCRFRCVSKPWLALCSDPAIRKLSPQTLSGFFFNDYRGLSFRNLSGGGTPLIDPALPFLRRTYKRFELQDDGCCRSSTILLLKCWKSYSKRKKHQYQYVVCNPATEEWRVLPLIVSPDVLQYDLFLRFDAATPSRFAVFARLRNSSGGRVMIYSSQTGRWTALQSKLAKEIVLLREPQCVFLNGIMYLSSLYCRIIMVDIERKTWREIELLVDMWSRAEIVTIGQSQGILHAWLTYNDNDSSQVQLSVWVLEDIASRRWTLKHTATNILELFGRECYDDDESFRAFAIHPDRNLIYITDYENITVSYDMDSREVQVMCTAEELWWGVPYTPCFAEWSSGGCN